MGSLRELGRLAYESKGGRLTTRSVESGVALTRPCGLCARELIKSTEDAGISSISRIISRIRFAKNLYSAGQNPGRVLIVPPLPHSLSWVVTVDPSPEAAFQHDRA